MNKVILFGAGKVGRRTFQVLKDLRIEDIVYCFCDNGLNHIDKIENIKVFSYAEVRNLGYPFIITTSKVENVNEIALQLLADDQLFFKSVGEYTDYLFSQKRANEKYNSLDRIKKEEISRNIIFKDTHNGESCFILGNGPSLMNIDMCSLSDKFTFTTNFITKVKGFESLHTNVQLWMDEAYWGKGLNNRILDEEIITNYINISKVRPAPVCFMPIDAYDYMHENGWDKMLDIHYIFPIQAIEPYQSRLYMNLSSIINGFNSVVQTSIIVAIYMGFTKIFLCGCDNTILFSLMNKKMNKNATLHAYSDDPYYSIDAKLDFTSETFEQTKISWGYKLLYGYCYSHGIELYNCTNPTLIDDIPKIYFNEALKNAN